MDQPGPSSLPAAPSYAGRWSTLKPRLHPALEEHVTSTLGFAQMTPVQSSVVPLFLSHKDVIVEAVTGSGKTLAYVLPVLQMIDRRNSKGGSSKLKHGQVGALIVCPTRELAVQVHGVIDEVLIGQKDNEEDVEQDEALKNASSDDTSRLAISGALLAVGGSTSSPADDYRAFKAGGADVIVGTPGRIEELTKRSGVDLKELEVLILDEADRLLDMGFQQSVSNIVQLLPKQRRTGLFSATMTDALGELARVGLRNPVRVVVKVEAKRQGYAKAAAPDTATDKRMPATLESSYLVARAEHKVLQLIRLLRREAQRPSDELPLRKAIVYFATCAQVNYFYKALSALSEMAGLKLYSLHGKQTPTRRRATYESFVSATPMGSAATTSDEQASILLCTDVAARGLDLPSVDLVVQFDPPTDPKVFSHRCGRTARAGRRGRAVVFLQRGREEDYVDFLRVRKNPVRPYPYLVEAGHGEKGNRPIIEAGKERLASEHSADIDPGALKIHHDMRQEVKADRALYEAGMQAFVSFVQAYRKHEASFVFREKDLDMATLAFSFGLLHLPSMPEVGAWRKRRAAQGEGAPPTPFVEERVDMSTFAYADKVREKQRLASRDAAAEAKKQAATNGDELTDPQKRRKARVAPAWSEQTARKERRQERRDKKQRKRQLLLEKSQAAMQSRAKTSERESADAGANDDDDDDDDWADEEREAKRARRAAVLAKSQRTERGIDDDDGGMQFEAPSEGGMDFADL